MELPWEQQPARSPAFKAEVLCVCGRFLREAGGAWCVCVGRGVAVLMGAP